MFSDIHTRLSASMAEIGRRFVRLFSIDYRSLAAFRVMAALTLIYVCAVFALDLGQFFSKDGLLSIELLNHYSPNHQFTLFEYFPSITIIWTFWSLLLLAAFSLLIGYKSRISAAICFGIYLFFIGRNPILAQGGDTLLRLLLFWAIFLPTGRMFGVDGALERGRDFAAEPRIFSVASVGLLLQVLYVYVFGALLKTGGTWMPGGQAVYIALHLDSFATPASYLFREYIIVTQLVTCFVFFLELFAPVLLFFPDKNMRVRTISLSLLMLMHLGFRLFLNIGHFWMASLASLMTYIPSRIWEVIHARYWKSHQRQIRIFYDRDCGFCYKTCLLLREFFLPHDVSITPAQDVPPMGDILERENSWVVVTPAGETLLHWNALVYVAKQSPIMRPLWFIIAVINVIGLGKVLYRLIGNNRKLLGKVTSFFLAFNMGPKPMNALLKVAVVGVILLCFVWNLDQNKPVESRSQWLDEVGDFMAKTGLKQRWSMFAPHPAISDGYAMLSFKDVSGAERFLRPDGSLGESYIHPERLNSHFSSYRWRKYLNRIARYDSKKRLDLFERYAEVKCTQIQEGNLQIPSETVEAIGVYWARNWSFKQKENEYSMEKIGEWACHYRQADKNK